MMEKEENKRAANCKGLGKLTLLFPCNNGGAQLPHKKELLQHALSTQR